MSKGHRLGKGLSSPRPRNSLKNLGPEIKIEEGGVGSGEFGQGGIAGARQFLSIKVFDQRMTQEGQRLPGRNEVDLIAQRMSLGKFHRHRLYPGPPRFRDGSDLFKGELYLSPHPSYH